MNAVVIHIWSLREQAQYLRSPMRRCGPSVHEADETATLMEREADDLSEALYDAANATLKRPRVIDV